MLKLFTLVFWLMVHPVHVTLLSIEYSEEKKLFEAFLRVYYDDFMLDYKLLTGKEQEFDISGNKEEAITCLNGYLKERVQLISGKTPLGFIITDINLSDNELNIYLQFKSDGISKVFTVKNSILADIYNDQSNLLIFRYKDFEEGVKLTPEKREHEFDVNKSLIN